MEVWLTKSDIDFTKNMVKDEKLAPPTQNLAPDGEDEESQS